MVRLWLHPSTLDIARGSFRKVKPLGLVEAKRTKKDFRIGQQQAKSPPSRLLLFPTALIGLVAAGLPYL
ncbi:MAG: hypothetical protein ACP5DX_09545 [Paracoccaceae bacterium]